MYIKFHIDLEQYSDLNRFATSTNPNVDEFDSNFIDTLLSSKYYVPSELVFSADDSESSDCEGIDLNAIYICSYLGLSRHVRFLHTEALKRNVTLDYDMCVFFAAKNNDHELLTIFADFYKTINFAAFAGIMIESNQIELVKSYLNESSCESLLSKKDKVDILEGIVLRHTSKGIELLTYLLNERADFKEALKSVEHDNLLNFAMEARKNAHQFVEILKNVERVDTISSVVFFGMAYLHRAVVLLEVLKVPGIENLFQAPHWVNLAGQMIDTIYSQISFCSAEDRRLGLDLHGLHAINKLLQFSGVKEFVEAHYSNPYAAFGPNSLLKKIERLNQAVEKEAELKAKFESLPALDLSEMTESQQCFFQGLMSASASMIESRDTKPLEDFLVSGAAQSFFPPATSAESEENLTVQGKKPQ